MMLVDDLLRRPYFLGERWHWGGLYIPIDSHDPCNFFSSKMFFFWTQIVFAQLCHVHDFEMILVSCKVNAVPFVCQVKVSSWCIGQTIFVRQKRWFFRDAGDVPSLKLRASSPLKNGVRLNYFPFGAKGLFSGAFAVSFREGISLLALLVWFWIPSWLMWWSDHDHCPICRLPYDIGGAISSLGWCIFPLNEERFGTLESSKSQGSHCSINLSSLKIGWLWLSPGYVWD